ncbi:putative transcriptional regulator (plasmid) [Ensifer sp. WSM1721]
MVVSSEKKQRLSVYLEPDLKRRLADFAQRREQSASLIAEAAIGSFLSPDADERKEAALVKRLDRLDRCLQRMERDLEITNETLALFIRCWLNSIVPPPE